MITINKLRDKIDEIDADIIKNISKRNDLSKQIGYIKSKINMEIIDKEREKQIRLLHERFSSEYGVDSEFIKGLFNLIIINSRRLQKSS